VDAAGESFPDRLDLDRFFTRDFIRLGRWRRRRYCDDCAADWSRKITDAGDFILNRSSLDRRLLELYHEPGKAPRRFLYWSFLRPHLFMVRYLSILFSSPESWIRSDASRCMVIDRHRARYWNLEHKSTAAIALAAAEIKDIIYIYILRERENTQTIVIFVCFKRIASIQPIDDIRQSASYEIKSFDRKGNLKKSELTQFDTQFALL